MTDRKTVKGYCKYAAEQFLQTAVFVDDQIYKSDTGPVREPRRIDPPKKRKSAIGGTHEEYTLDEPASSDDETETVEFSPHDIVTSFAEKQIVCSLYQPKNDAKMSPQSDIFALCLAADIVIVDWDIYGDAGGCASVLIAGLVKQSVLDVPEQLRLIIVYSQEINLHNIANRLYESVNEIIDEALDPKDEAGLVFHTANSRVSIFGKPGRDRPDVPVGHIVKEENLADVAIGEFAELASGLLHAATLLGLAEIKKNSRKVLSKFNEKLDPGFLTHLAMSLPDGDASSHVIPLLISEIESVLEDALPTPLISEELLKDWCGNVWKPGDHPDQIFPTGNAKSDDDEKKRAIAETICLKGFDYAKSKFSEIPNPNNTKNVRKAGKFLLREEDDDSNHLFSHLMSSRTFYGKKPKTLSLGTIVHNPGKDSQYFLCIQPVCDTVRLKGDTAFLFVKLTKTDPQDGRVSHVVVNDNGEVLELFYQAKSFQCYVATFSPENRGSKRVMAELQEDNHSNHSYVFTDTANKAYIWLGQLKTAHAQRAVERLASDLSRVGLAESEWLRRLDK